MLQNLLLNVFIIKLPLVLFGILLQQRGYRERIGALPVRLLIGLICGLSALLCVLFPVVVADGFRWDLACVPLILAILYGGPVAGGAATLIYVLMDLLTSQGEPVIEMAALVVALLLPLIVRSRYAKLTFLYKQAWCLASSLLTYVVSLNIVLYASDSFDRNLESDRLPFLAFQAATIVSLTACTYLLEKLFVWATVQERLLQAERLTMISDMAASIAHEVRNPLTVVKGFLQLLSTSKDEKTRLYMNTSIAELDRAEFIISDYLNMAKSQPDQDRPLQVGELVEAAILTLTPYSVMQNIELRHLCSNDMVVMGDRVKFNQVIINLVKNAIEAMVNGGIVEVQAFQQENEVFVKVLDNGQGMSQEQLRKIGTPYFSSKEKGTGLGTMVVFRIVESMGGSIRYQSEIGQGTQVVLRFPAITEAEKAVSLSVG